MSGSSVFCDTNIIVYLLDGDAHIAELLHGRDTRLSFITELELLSKEGLTPSERTRITSFLNQCTIMDITSAIKKRVIEIRQKTKVKLPDAIIGATAIDLNLPLLTADKRLEKIPGLHTVIFK